ncbi:MAG TPA: hypothetical protein VMZ03_01280 [Chitinophagaceae bacterium]|nr:hypothetical protein [Chitinophagaceae bacterium]
MISTNRDMMVMLRKEGITDKEIQFLRQLLRITESPIHFCTAHELVDRNRITSNHKKILKRSRHFFLGSFRFLINKN